MIWFIYIVTFALFGFTLYRVWKLVEYYRRKSASQLWTPVTGKVIEKQIRLAARGMYYPEISYSYTVMGIEYKNKFSMGTMLLGKARATLDQIGGEVGLRYNPQNPKQGVADQEKASPWDIYMVVMGLAAIFVVLVYLLAK